MSNDELVTVHFPSELTGMVPGDAQMPKEDAEKILDNRRWYTIYQRRIRVRLRKASAAYKENPTPRRRKALLGAIFDITSAWSSHIRTDKLIEAAWREPPEIWWPAFFDAWSVCDAGAWAWRSWFLHKFRTQPAIAYLDDEDREFYDNLPELIEVWRGADRRTVRNFSWTTDKKTAELFAVHRRGRAFTDPVIAHAFIRKADVFAAIGGRGEREIILEPRRLRKLTIESSGGAWQMPYGPEKTL